MLWWEFIDFADPHVPWTNSLKKLSQTKRVLSVEVARAKWWIYIPGFNPAMSKQFPVAMEDLMANMITIM